MAAALPIEMMLGLLRTVRGSPLAYVKLWQSLVRSIGGSIGLTISRDGEDELGICLPCDAQIRHRSRWLHYLVEDLHRDPEHRDLMVTMLLAQGRYADNRPAESRAITHAVRDFLQVGGRILIDPKGELDEGGGLPRAFTNGSDAQAAECIRASKAYLAVRRRWRSEIQIRRAVQMLGRRTANGWTVLERLA